jgi:hypothetical protein
MDDKIETAAEAFEATAIPRVHECHAGSEAKPAPMKPLPDRMKKTVASKSPAQWAYERLILYIQNFEEQLDAKHEVAMGFTGGGAGVLRIEGMGYFDPDIVTFYGSEPNGARTQLIQHVSQLSVMLRALPKSDDTVVANRIGFRLAADLEEG